MRQIERQIADLLHLSSDHTTIASVSVFLGGITAIWVLCSWRR